MCFTIYNHHILCVSPYIITRYYFCWISPSFTTLFLVILRNLPGMGYGEGRPWRSKSCDLQPLKSTDRLAKRWGQPWKNDGRAKSYYQGLVTWLLYLFGVLRYIYIYIYIHIYILLYILYILYQKFNSFKAILFKSIFASSSNGKPPMAPILARGTNGRTKTMV